MRFRLEMMKNIPNFPSKNVAAIIFICFTLLLFLWKAFLLERKSEVVGGMEMWVKVSEKNNSRWEYNPSFWMDKTHM